MKSADKLATLDDGDEAVSGRPGNAESKTLADTIQENLNNARPKTRGDPIIKNLDSSPIVGGELSSKKTSSNNMMVESRNNFHSRRMTHENSDTGTSSKLGTRPNPNNPINHQV